MKHPYNFVPRVYHPPAPLLQEGRKMRYPESEVDARSAFG